MRTFVKHIGVVCAAVVAFTLLSSAHAASAPGQTGVGSAFVVPLYHSKAIELDRPAARVSVGNPDVADILILRASQLYVIGKDLGTTNVLLWDKSDNLVGNFDVQITHDLADLKRKFFELLPNEPIEVYSAQRAIVLRGTVSSIGVMDAALSIAEGYLTQAGTSTETTEFELEESPAGQGEVINLMQVGGGQQVMLEVKIAEINRSEVKRLNAQFNGLSIGDNNWNFGGVNGGATFPDAIFGDGDNRIPVFTENPFGPAVDEFAPNPMTIANHGITATFLSETAIFNMAIDAAKENGLAKILAEPTLTTLTGESASFLSGGEFPIPVPNGDDGTTVEFKSFGVELDFHPVVLGSGKINFKLNVKVSDIDPSTALVVQSEGSSRSIFAPGLSTRGATVTLEMTDGDTMSIAGLISENLREVVSKFPGLGEIPVLGALFRSQEFQNNESELVILVTPRLAKPLSPEDIRLPTDSFVEPTDLEFYFLGRTEGRTPKTNQE
jgi:pilus assembly protein CpaC